MAGDPVVIRNAVIHLTNEQPLVADLFAPPTAADLLLVCTNLRTLGGKRPVFADHSGSVFYFPFSHIRFLEIPPGADGSPVPDESRSRRPEPAPAEEELEIDEDFLRRVRDV